MSGETQRGGGCSDATRQQHKVHRGWQKGMRLCRAYAQGPLLSLGHYRSWLNLRYPKGGARVVGNGSLKDEAGNT